MTARCDSKGSYDKVQCMNDECFCTDPTGGLNGDESVNITKGLSSLPCCKYHFDFVLKILSGTDLKSFRVLKKKSFLSYLEKNFL